jgi:hypothetical protein
MTTIAARRRLRARSVHGGNLLCDFDIAVRHLTTDIITGQLEGHFAVRDTHIGVVIYRLEIRDEAVDKTERVHEILKLERSRKLVLCECPSGQPRHDGAQLFSCQDLRLVHRGFSVSRLAASL